MKLIISLSNVYLVILIVPLRAVQLTGKERDECREVFLYALKCQYLNVEQGRELYGIYNQVLSGLVNMINNPHRWVIGK